MSGKMTKMNKIAINKLEEILNELNKTPGIIGSAIIKKDGETIVKQMPRYVDDEFVDILSAIHGCIEQVLSKSDEIAPKEVIIRGKYRNTIIINVGDAILMIISDLKANLKEEKLFSEDYKENYDRLLLLFSIIQKLYSSFF